MKRLQHEHVVGARHLALGRCLCVQNVWLRHHWLAQTSTGTVPLPAAHPGRTACGVGFQLHLHHWTVSCARRAGHWLGRGNHRRVAQNATDRCRYFGRRDDRAPQSVATSLRAEHIGYVVRRSTEFA